MVVCVSCGAELSEHDRVCLACGTPAHESLLNPRFAIDDQLRAPSPEDPDERSAAEMCPRCRATLVPGEPFCVRCGMDVTLRPDLQGWAPPPYGEVWQAEWGDAASVWPGSRVGGVEPFQPLDDLLPWLRVLVGGAVCTSAMLAVVALARYVIFGSAADSVLWEHLGTTEALLDIFRVTTGLLVIAGAAAFVVIFDRAYRNLPALGGRGMRYTPVWALWAWVVPGMNVVRPKDLACDLWRISDPARPLHPSVEWRYSTVPAVLHLWWWSFVGSVVGAIVAEMLDPGGDAATVADPGRARMSALVLLGAQSLRVLSGVTGLAFVTELAARQRVRASLIGDAALVGYPLPAAGERAVPAPPLPDLGPNLRRPPPTLTGDEVPGRY